MDYKKNIIELIDKIEDRKVLRCIYIIVSNIVKEFCK